MEFKRRISTKEAGPCGNLVVCPDIWEADNGDFIVVGKDVTEELRDHLPSDVGVAGNEKIVLLPRRLVISAKPNIPEA